MRKTNQKGFTIIELLVVIVIIGILVALALPQLFAAQARGRDTDRKNDLKNLQQKLETFFNDNDRYPDQTDDQDMDDAKINPDTDFTGPRDSTYEYDCSADDCQSYTLSVTLENDKDKDANNDGDYVLESVNKPETETPETP